MLHKLSKMLARAQRCSFTYYHEHTSHTSLNTNSFTCSQRQIDQNLAVLWPRWRSFLLFEAQICLHMQTYSQHVFVSFSSSVHPVFPYLSLTSSARKVDRKFGAGGVNWQEGLGGSWVFQASLPLAGAEMTRRKHAEYRSNLQAAWSTLHGVTWAASGSRALPWLISKGKNKWTH